MSLAELDEKIGDSIENVLFLVGAISLAGLWLWAAWEAIKAVLL